MTKLLLFWLSFILDVLFSVHEVRDWGTYFESLYLRVSPCCSVHAHVVACTIMIMTCSREVILAPPPLPEAQSSEFVKGIFAGILPVVLVPFAQ